LTQMKTVVLRYNRDSHGSRESTADLTAPVRPFIVGVVPRIGLGIPSDTNVSSS
jgi:hypothetical protein